MKGRFLVIALLLFTLVNRAQVIYNNSFDNLSLLTYTTANSTTKYSLVPAGFNVIDDGLKNNTGSSNNPNKPFNEPSLKTSGWSVVYNETENDTFLVSTSWLDTTGVSVNRWVITPFISNITANTVLTWLAKSPDAAFADGYEVYGTSNAGALTPQSFTIGDRLFFLADGNTFGGGEKNTWTRRSISLGAFAGQSLRFAFRNNSKDLYQLWIDDLEVISTNNLIDAGLSVQLPKKYVLKNVADSVKFILNNLGASTINSLSVSYQIGNSSINTENMTIGSGLSYGQSALLKFAYPSSISSPGYYTVKCWINSVNGQADQNPVNDTLDYALTIQDLSPNKVILFEQFVSANNGEGPDAQEKTLALQSPSVIVVNIHDLDSLKETNTSPLINDYKKMLPTALIDRVYYSELNAVALERQSYNRVNSRMSEVTPVSISVINKSYNSSTRQLSFTLKADFVGEVKGDYRLNAYLTENHVSGPVTDTSINGFNQLNNFYNVPWSSYYQRGYYSPVVNTYVLNYWEFRHQNALVFSFDGAYGSSGTIPSTGGTQGQSYQQTFSLKLPSPGNGRHQFNVDNLYIVGFASEYSTNKNNRNVLNAVKEKVTSNAEAVGIQENYFTSSLMIYPNPSRGLFYFKHQGVNSRYEIAVYDLLGKCLKNIEVMNSQKMEPLDLSEMPAGVYVLKVNTGKANFTEKVIIQKQ